MNQYAMDRWARDPRPYAEHPITAPTSRRIDVWIDATTPEFRRSGKHLALIEDTYGDNCVMIATGTWAERQRVTKSPAGAQTIAHWHMGQPCYGTWAYYLADIAFVRVAVEVLGWTLTAEEQALMDALEEYGRRAPARLRAV
jgi:hypothetical protein